MSAESRAIATKILNISEEAHGAISGVLEQYGSTAAEMTISAVYGALMAVYEALERESNGS